MYAHISFYFALEIVIWNKVQVVHTIETTKLGWQDVSRKNKFMLVHMPYLCSDNDVQYKNGEIR